MARLEQFGCHNCGKVLGWTAPGEASRMNQRARLYCDACKDLPADLTPRQSDFLTVLREIAERGERPTLAAAADQLGISRSRAQQIKDAIKARGGTDINALLDGVSSEPLPEPKPTEPTTAERYASLAPITPIAQPDDWSYAEPEYVAPSGTPDSTDDPAVFGGEFV